MKFKTIIVIALIVVLAVSSTLLLTLATSPLSSVSSLPVHNIDTGEDFTTIQEAIDDPDTLNGHTIVCDANTYHEVVNVYKSLTIKGENKSNTTIDGMGLENVVLISASNVTISGFTVNNSGYVEPGAYGGIGIVDSCNVSVIDNNLIHNDDGIWLYNVNSSIIAYNNISYNGKAGIYSRYSSQINISNNTAISNNNWGIVAQTGSNNITVFNNIIVSNNYTGIQVGMSTIGNKVINNTVLDSDYGIMVVSSNETTVSDNVASHNRYIGLILDTSRETIITSNVLSNNDQAGMYIYNSNENRFTCNNITDNGNLIATSAGIYIEDSDNNILYHNNFINNLQIQVENINSVNNWDNGYPSGGNYWSDYSGADLYSGPHQNETGSDGIGDTPSVIDGSNQDNYPLMEPWPSNHIRIYWIPTCPYPFVPSLTPRAWEPVHVTASIIVSSEPPDKVVLSYTVDNSEEWNTTMSYNPLTDLWTSTVPGQPSNTSVTFFVEAYDRAGLQATSSTYNWTVNDYIYAYADINGDGKIDMKDIGRVARLFGK